MKNKCVWQVSLAVVLLGGLLILPARAQQSGVPPKSTKDTPSSGVGPTTVTNADASATSDKVVLKVGTSEVTQADVDFLISNLNPQAQQALAAQGRRPIGEEYIKVLLLLQQAVSDHLDSFPDIRRRIALQRVQLLAQAEYEKMLRDVKVSPEEIGQYFSAHQNDFESAQVREFVIRKRSEGSNDSAQGLATEEAKAKAEAIRKAVADGTDPKKVIQDFAIPNIVMIDTDARTVQRGKLLPALDKAAFDLKVGEVSDPLDTPQALVFLQIVGHHSPEQKEVAADIENTLKQQKLETEIAGTRKKTEIWMDEDYFKGQTTTPSSTTQQPGSSGQPPASVQKPKS